MAEKISIQPVDDRVLIRPVEEGETKIGSIIIPDTAKEKPQIGEVLAVGTDEDLQNIIKVADKVIFAKYGGTEFEYRGEKYLIVSRSDILAVLND
jgi:chaperonin GroES